MFEKLIQIYDSYGAFRRLAAKKLGVPAIKVTIKEVRVNSYFIRSNAPKKKIRGSYFF